MSERISVAVLGATGSVGQRFVQLLDGHPWFEVVALTGSQLKSGLSYSQGCHWVLDEPMPEWAGEMILQDSDLISSDVSIAFSAMPSKVAREIEPQLARDGIMVCSNASAFREEPDVPILLPEVNPDHCELIATQRHNREWEGGIVTNPNCTSAGMTVVLKALEEAFGLKKVFVVSMQALSGAGYPGVASLDIIDNVIPFINGEEPKVEWEPRKMLGTLAEGSIDLAEFVISAHTNRVAVRDGHMVCLSVELKNHATVEQVQEALSVYQAPAASRELPSAPQPVILVRDEPERPQPRLDRMAGKGMTTVVGRLRPDPLFDMKMVVLSHNTIRGAAGGSIYNAELLVQEGFIHKHAAQ
jgi:aspartate-semialdehyde dehydrogenase